MWISVTEALRVLGLRMEETASKYGGKLRIYLISSILHLTTVDPPAWGLGEGPKTPRRKETACYIMLHRTSDLGSLKRSRKWNMAMRFGTWNGYCGNWVGMCGLDLSDSGQGPVVGCCEHGNELSVSIKRRGIS
jgi:hypothetical protein